LLPAISNTLAMLLQVLYNNTCSIAKVLFEKNSMGMRKSI